MFISLELFTKRIKQENKYKKCYKIVTNGLTNSRGIFIIGHMNRLRDSAIVLGLAGMLLMVSADTKDVEAKISYESESIDRSTEDDTAGVLRGIGTELLGAVAENRVDSGRMRQTYAEAEGYWPEEEEQQETVSDIENEVEEMEEEIDQTVVSEKKTAETEPVTEAASVQPELVVPENSIYVITAEDYDALLRIVEAEASGEDETGRLLVANVVLNRVRSAAFPNTVSEVVYQRKNGKAQFSPVHTGKIARVTVSDATRAAVARALTGEDVSEGALYFVNPTLADAGNLKWFREHLTLLFAYHGHEFYL